MLKFKSVLKKAIFNDPFDSIYSGSTDRNDYSMAIQHFQGLSADKKSKLIAEITSKLNKTQSNRFTTAILILCDFLSSTNPEANITFPHKLLTDYKQAAKQAKSRKQKTKMVENNLILFYIEYLRVKVWNPCTFDDPNNLMQATRYCEQAIEAMKNILSYDFVIEYALLHSSFKELVKIMIENILRRVSVDLTIIIKYVNKFTYLIVQESPDSVPVNEIYEQLISISKNVHRFETLNRSIEADLKFPRYRLDRGLNSTIEQAMIGRQKQKIIYNSQRRLKPEEVGDEEGMDLAQTTQAQIFYKHDLSI